MSWPNHIERWRQAVQDECIDVDPDFVLSLIDQESNGVAGKKAGTATKFDDDLPSIHGGYINFQYALGLMQVIPITITGYNDNHPNHLAYYEQMRGKDLASARVQIRVGCWVYRKEVAKCHRDYPEYFHAKTPANASVDQLLIGLLGYRMGWGKVIPRLNKLIKMGLALTYQNIKANFPNWGQRPDGTWINRPIHYVDTIWNRALKHGMTPGGWQTYPPGSPIPQPEPMNGHGGGAIAVFAALLAVAYLWKGFKR